ncbi:efflux RND transporter periplasmic adaptor subunit [bacterium]|nr:efflux RND transporter periplasmic adaptor subunit [bacterium]
MKRTAARLLLSALTVFAAGCGKENVETLSMDSLHEENGVPVRVEPVVLKQLGREYTFNEILTGAEETDATSLVEDKVESVKFKVGDHVAKDQIVITFPTDNPQARYHQASVAMEFAKTTLSRIEKLYAEGGISLQELDNTRTQFKVAEANWYAVRQTVMVKAPIDGVITRINVRESDNVKAGDKLFTVSRTHRLKAEVWAGEDQIGGISKGQAASAVWRDRKIEGRVVQVDQSLDEKRQAFRVVIEFDNPGQQVMNGVNADITIGAGNDKPSIIVARSNLRRDGDTWYVYVAVDSLAVRREVLVGRHYDVDVEILQGLNPGDMLITKGLELLADRKKIRIITD